jgi:hypothetical protein
VIVCTHATKVAVVGNELVRDESAVGSMDAQPEMFHSGIDGEQGPGLGSGVNDRISGVGSHRRS